MLDVQGSKRSMPSKAQIVRYWIQWEKDHGTVPPWGDWDWGEPACMACGWWREGWGNAQGRRSDSPSLWRDVELERCHVVPRYMGGSDDVSNLVIMCSRCHASHLDSADPNVTYDYMRGRAAWWLVCFPQTTSGRM